MLFIVRFTDKPDGLATRKQFLPAHLQWLEQHQQTVLVAGSLRSEADAVPVGGLWVVEAQSKAEVGGYSGQVRIVFQPIRPTSRAATADFPSAIKLTVLAKESRAEALPCHWAHRKMRP